MSRLKKLAEDVKACLESRGRRLVLAESCTGGLVAATLARIPSISEFFCGSAVVYRLDTKSRWLHVPRGELIDPGPVSEIVARRMALGVLEATPEADYSAAITGHLGPGAPENEDGLVFVAVASRDAGAGNAVLTVQRHWLGDPAPEEMTASDPLRERRQVRAAELVLRAALDAMSTPDFPERGASAP